MRNLIPTLLAISLVAGTGSAAAAGPAQAAHRFGDYVVHPGTMITSNLDPQVASEYDIQRSDHRGMVTVAVRKGSGDGPGKPVKAKVTASLTNLSAQHRELEMREVDEGQAIYYLTDFRIDPPETVKVNFRIQPQGSDKTLDFQVSRTFGSAE